MADPDNWLPPDSRIDVRSSPEEWLSVDGPLTGNALLGKLLFNSPSLFGEKAVRMGLSCNSCHPSGHVNTGFFMSGLSDVPGTIDVTNKFWRSGTEDGLFNPLAIPSLRGVNKTAPYGTLTVLPTLEAFTTHVIEDEFAGPHVQSYELSALVAYMSLFQSTPKADMQTYVEANTSSYLSLLLGPLEKDNADKTVRIIHLIREELGRRIKLSPATRGSYKDLLQTLKTIQRNARTSPAVAQQTLREHLLSAD